MKNKKYHSGWNTGIVHIWNLPEDKIYVDLKKEFKYKLLFSAKGNKPWKHFTMFHGVHHDILLSYKYRQRVSLKVIWKLLEIANKNKAKITKEDIEKNIIKLGAHQSFIENPKLPFRFDNSEGAKFIAAMLHDGGIRERLVPFYTNSNIKKRKEVSNLIKEIFGDIKIKGKYSGEIQDFIIAVGIILVYGLGMKKGNKVLTNPNIPEFIFNLDENSISNYLRQAYDDDGYVLNGKRRNHKLVGITCNTGDLVNPPFPNLLNDIKRLLNKINIKSQNITKSKSKFAKSKGYLSQEWKLFVYRIESLQKFKDLVNFNIDYKKENLSLILNEISGDKI